ncbi:hypothetical protein HYALB_00001661 [Hymenoscyphus albidus]|uniref:Uncharacterized protein n=1 Tax=Hymenoscyphus albidus TaxID=595503 RepID=A0A9N9LDT4_9HELO|nr:hypothetical protein HYALB_00001661 [Hymenoscyphus albidus]
MEKQVIESTRLEAGPGVLGSHVHSSLNRDEQEMAFFGKTQQLKVNNAREAYGAFSLIYLSEISDSCPSPGLFAVCSPPGKGYLALGQ